MHAHNYCKPRYLWDTLTVGFRQSGKLATNVLQVRIWSMLMHQVHSPPAGHGRGPRAEGGPATSWQRGRSSAHALRQCSSNPPLLRCVWQSPALVAGQQHCSSCPSLHLHMQCFPFRHTAGVIKSHCLWNDKGNPCTCNCRRGYQLLPMFLPYG